MKIIRGLEFHTGSKEEKLPDFDLDFPYICSRAELDHYEQSLVPWHWHRAVEIFYMESGKLEYFTLLAMRSKSGNPYRKYGFNFFNYPGHLTKEGPQAIRWKIRSNR